MTTIIKKDGTRKAVKVNGFVSEKSIAVYDRQTKSYMEKERPAVKLMSAAYVSNVHTFKVRVSNIYVWLQKGTKAKDKEGLHIVKFVAPSRNYDKYDENWDKKAINNTQFAVAKKFLLTTDLKNIYWEDLEDILVSVGAGVDASKAIAERIHVRNEEEKAERLSKKKEDSEDKVSA